MLELARELPGPVRSASVTVIIPAYNEGLALRDHLMELTQYFDTHGDFRAIDYVVVDDGSSDETYEAASAIASARNDVLVVRHGHNRGLGAALRTACKYATGDLVLTVDADLSYRPECLLQLLRAAEDNDAALVMASAYMRGGRVHGVPFIRAILSREANRFLSLATGGDYATLTCMVRVYRRELLKTLAFGADGMDINAELALQTIRRRAHVVEIPATLSWPERRKQNAGRASLRSICKLTYRTLKCGFRHRPALAVAIPGLVPGLLPAVVAAMVLLHSAPKQIAIGTTVTLIVQFGSLAILGSHALSFAARVNAKRRPANQNHTKPESQGERSLSPR